MALGLGSASITSMKSLKKALVLLELAYNLGIRHFDTAPLYGAGYSEIIIGKFLKNKPKDFKLSTKFGLGNQYKLSKIPVSLLMPTNYYLKKAIGIKATTKANHNKKIYQNILPRRIDKKEVENNFFGSLKKLYVDYIDYYFLHEGFPSFLTDEALIFLQDLKTKGHINHLGIGTNAGGISNLSSAEVQFWDILQYEGYDNLIVSDLLARFPDKVHFHHSCLKKINESNIELLPSKELAGYLLAKLNLCNPSGVVIFSTRNIEYLKNNILSYSKYFNQ